MTTLEVLEKMKTALMITSSAFDQVLSIHIENVKNYMINAGVKESVVNSEKSIGAILRGVSDLWNNDSGKVDFSPYFRDQVVQLSFLEGDNDVSTEANQ